MTRALITALFTLTFVGSSFFTEFTGFESSQLPIPQINPPIQPAGYAFAIWGLIYVGLLVSAGFGIRDRATDPAWDIMRAPLIVSLAVGTPWLWVATQSPIAATVMIFIMLVGALLAMRLAPVQDHWWSLLPISIYAGWLTAASFVSLGSVAAGYGLLFDQDVWVFVCIALALCVTLATQWTSPAAPAYGITVIWALQGIVVANGESYVSTAAIVGGALIAALLVFQLRRTLRPSTT